MKTIADTYRDEGRQEGVVQGIEIGKAEGEHNKAIIIDLSTVFRTVFYAHFCIFSYCTGDR